MLTFIHVQFFLSLLCKGLSLKTGKAIMTWTTCSGLKFDASVGAGISIAFFGDYKNIPGKSLVLSVCENAISMPYFLLIIKNRLVLMYLEQNLAQMFHL